MQIVHKAHRLEMEGESMRKNIGKKTVIEKPFEQNNELTEICNKKIRFVITKIKNENRTKNRSYF